MSKIDCIYTMYTMYTMTSTLLHSTPTSLLAFLVILFHQVGMDNCLSILYLVYRLYHLTTFDERPPPYTHGIHPTYNCTRFSLLVASEIIFCTCPSTDNGSIWVKSSSCGSTYSSVRRILK
jgi:hypothetical protein